MCQHERMTLEGEQIRDYVKFFCTSDSSSRVLHLVVAEPLSKASKQENKQGEEKDGRSGGARK
jgi:hypothetical protein